MRRSPLYLTAAMAAAITIGSLAITGYAGRRDGDARVQIGPDVVAWTIAGQNNFDMGYYGSVGGIGGYAIATQSCNWGDQEANWFDGTNEAPLISMNAYRLKDGRFEQIGLSWLKHSFCALSEPGCGSCQATNCNTLGIGCADTYWAGLNANGHGPRSDVNAFTGEYPFPHTVTPSGPNSLRGNIQIANSDVDPAQNPNAKYFVEGQYVAHDDATWGNQMNNASWREIGFSSFSSPYAINQNGVAETHAGDPAILAWAQHDPSVTITEVITPDDGKVIIGVKVTDLGGGMYRYEYAIQNLNCHRSIQKVEIPTGTSSVSGVGFHDVNYHSGEIFDGTDWTSFVAAGTVTWNTVTFAQNPNGNALRWGSLYNFRFDASAAPKAGDIGLTFFKPSGVSTVSDFTVSTIIPLGAQVDPCTLPLGPCPEDIDSNGIVAVGDILELIAHFGECGDGTYRPIGDIDDDCCVTVNDLLMVIGAWDQDCTPVGACCLPQGGCNESSTEADCLNAGGVYQGDQSTCAQASCPELGACCFSDGACSMMLPSDCTNTSGTFQGQGVSCNDADCPVSGDGDECHFAMQAVMGANSFETNTATPSSPEPDESQCSDTYLDWDNSPDVWFYWVATVSGNVYFTTCDSSSYDTSMALYEGDCDNQVACNGDASGETGCQAYYSAFNYNVTVGEVYYIRLGGWQGISGTGTLTIE